MARASTAPIRTDARPAPNGASFALLGGAERQERVFAALHASLAHETLPTLDADVRSLLPTMTWAQIAQTMRVTGSSEWRSGLTVAATAAPHQVLWLLVGGDAPCPRLLKGGHHRALVDALVSKVVNRFEQEAATEDNRVKKVNGTYNRPAARAQKTPAQRIQRIDILGVVRVSQMRQTGWGLTRVPAAFAAASSAC